VTSFFGGSYRFRPVEEVVEEVKATGSRNIFFVDDNIAANPSRAKELFQALIPLRLRWLSQANLTVAHDPELLDLAVRSGCFALFIGLESLSETNLRQAGKIFNLWRKACGGLTDVSIPYRPCYTVPFARPNTIFLWSCL
jgi:radical SAM superfamily enzyme YgiQ (UPF0313 family)